MLEKMVGYSLHWENSLECSNPIFPSQSAGSGKPTRCSSKMKMMSSNSSMV
jgi:hypothetical protein